MCWNFLILFRYFWYTFLILLRFLWDTFGKLVGYFWDTFRILLGWYLVILGDFVWSSVILGDLGELRTSSGLSQDYNRIFKFYSRVWHWFPWPCFFLVVKFLREGSATNQGWPNPNQDSAKLLVSPCFARVRFRSPVFCPFLPSFALFRPFFAPFLPGNACFLPGFARFRPVSPGSFGFVQIYQDSFGFVRPLFAWFRPSLLPTRCMQRGLYCEGFIYIVKA